MQALPESSHYGANSMHSKLKLFFFLVLCIYGKLLHAQQTTIDSLEHELTIAQDDTTKINLHYYLADLLFGYDSIRPRNHLTEGLALAKKINDNYQIAVYYYWRGSFLARSSHFSKSLPFMDTALLFFNKHAEKFAGDEKIQTYVTLTKANLMNEYATAYMGLYQYEKAVNSYLQSIKDWQGVSSTYPKRDETIGMIYVNIATTYRQIGQFENALKYCRMSVPYRVRDGNKEYLARSFMEISVNFTSLNNFDSARIYLKKAKPLVTGLDQPLLNVNFYLRQGEYFRLTRDFKNALSSYQMAKENALKINHRFHLAGSTIGMAESHLGANNIGKARDEALEALSIAEELHSAKLKLKSLSILAETEEKGGNINEAFYYQKQRLALKDTLEREDVKKKLMELDAHYQSALKDAKIVQMNKEGEIQELEGEKKSIFIYFLSGSLVAILAMSFLGYRNFLNKQTLAKQTALLQTQRIKELELEKQLIAYNSLLTGQELERSRMAKDLHDGLGGMLSGVKLSLGAMKGNIILSEDNTRLFAKVLDQLDHSIREMRRVAHNMMPEALVKLGLQQAIQDYCDGLNESIQLHFKVQFHGLETRLEAATEIVVYRIVQELLNNVVKHANATVVLVQIMRHGNNLNITIEDNGKGFETSRSNKGDGLNNVRSRVDYLKGQLDIQSVLGNGTSIHIDLTIQET